MQVPVQTDNYAATRDPGATDDSNAGYGRGSNWENATASPKRMFICTDATATAAVWIQVSGGGGVSLPIAESDVTGLVSDLTAKASTSALTSHTSNTSNPHSVTKAQVGLSAVANALQLVAASNLSDLASASAARTNLALGTAATQNVGTSANNVPQLDSNGLLATSIFPPLAIIKPNVVANQAAMLALTAQRGDVAVRSDINEAFMLATDDPTQLGNWVPFAFTAQTVVNGKGGPNITLVPSDIGADASGAAATVQTNLTSHTSATAAHGATGAVVGTTNTQSFSNKTIPDGNGNSVSAIMIAGTTVDPTAIADTYILSYDAGTNHLIYAPNGGGGSQDIASVLGVGSDAGGASVTNLGGVGLAGGDVVITGTSTEAVLEFGLQPAGGAQQRIIWFGGNDASGDLLFKSGATAGAGDRGAIRQDGHWDTIAGYSVGGTQVVGSQQAAIPDSDGSEADNARAVNAWLAAARAGVHGLIAA